MHDPTRLSGKPLPALSQRRKSGASPDSLERLRDANPPAAIACGATGFDRGHSAMRSAINAADEGRADPFLLDGIFRAGLER
jgi:hypothetical protein